MEEVMKMVEVGICNMEVRICRHKEVVVTEMVEVETCSNMEVEICRHKEVVVRKLVEVGICDMEVEICLHKMMVEEICSNLLVGLDSKAYHHQLQHC
jgi:hypothetical protein